jgi:hypothetical protein
VYYATESFGSPADVVNFTNYANGRKVSGITDLGYSLTGLTGNTTHYVVIVAESGAGSSEPSIEKAGLPAQVPIPAPSAPTGLLITAGIEQLDVSWSSVATAASYSVYYATESFGSPADVANYASYANGRKISGTTSPNYSLTSLMGNTTYYVAVVAENVTGSSSPSIEKSGLAKYPLPDQPSGVTVTSGIEQLDVSWSSVATATSYTLYYATESFGSSADVANFNVYANGKKVSGLTDSNYSLTSLTGDTTYYVAVVAENASGSSGPSTEQSGLAAYPIPNKPLDLIVYDDIEQLYVSWGAVVMASSYSLYYATESFGSPVDVVNYSSYANGRKVSGITDPNNYLLTDLDGNTTYYLAVVAENATGSSEPSAEKSGLSIQSVPNKPINVVVTSGIEQLDISWDEVSTASSYSLIYATESFRDDPHIAFDYSYFANGAKVADITDLSHALTDLMGNTTYYVAVVAENTTGSSVPSREAFGLSADTVPHRPVNVVIAEGTAQLDVSWNAVETATSYTLYYATESFGSPADLANYASYANGKKISDITNLNYSLTNLLDKTTYYVVVVAENVMGNTSGGSTENSGLFELELSLKNPENLFAKGDIGKFEVSWDRVLGATHYNLYYATESLGIPADIDNFMAYENAIEVIELTEAAYTVENISNNVTYYVTVVAFDGLERSSPSDEVQGRAYSLSLNDTGITKGADPYFEPSPEAGAICSVESITTKDCSNGRDVTHNDDNDGDNGFSFTKLDDNGAPLPASQTEWNCVKDNNTGFIWAAKTDDDDLYDKDDRYTWYSSDTSRYGENLGSENGSGESCFGYYQFDNASYCNTEAYVKRVNKEKLCGINSWRLPTVKELTSIINYGKSFPSIDIDYFPNTQAAYWTDTLAASPEYNEYVWYVDHRRYGDSFNRVTGAGIGNGEYIRLVAANREPDEISNMRYINNDDGTITDTLTSLMWTQCSDGLSGDMCNEGTALTSDFYEALQLAEDAAHGGYDDWRMPNIEELRSLVLYESYSPAISSSVFPNTLSELYWSSSPYAYLEQFNWTISFGLGGDHYTGWLGNHNVRLVRDAD